MVRISFEHLAQVNSRLAFFLRNRRRVTLVRPRRAAPPAARARPRPPPRPRRSTASQSGRAPSCRTCRTDTRIGNFLIKGALTFPHSRRKLQKGCNDSASLSHPESNLVPKESVWIRCLLSEVACLKQSPSRWSRLKSTFCQSWEFESLLFPQNHCSPKMLPPEKAEQSPAAAVLSIETCCVAGLLRRRPMSQLFVRWQHARRLQRVPLLCMSAVWAGFYFCVTATQYAQCCSLSVIWGHGICEYWTITQNHLKQLTGKEVEPLAATCWCLLLWVTPVLSQHFVLVKTSNLSYSKLLEYWGLTSILTVWKHKPQTVLSCVVSWPKFGSRPVWCVLLRTKKAII